MALDIWFPRKLIDQALTDDAEYASERLMGAMQNDLDATRRMESSFQPTPAPPVSTPDVVLPSWDQMYQGGIQGGDDYGAGAWAASGSTPPPPTAPSLLPGTGAFGVETSTPSLVSTDDPSVLGAEEGPMLTMVSPDAWYDEPQYRTPTQPARQEGDISEPSPWQGGGPSISSPPVLNPTGDHRTDTIRAAAVKHGVDPDILDAQLRQEGAYSPDVWAGQRKSSAGATGPGQFMKATGDAVAKQMGLDPETFWNSPELQVEGAAVHMADLLRNNEGDYNKALAAYNAGQGAVNKYGGVPPFAETQTYVSNIMAGKQRYGVVNQAPEKGPAFGDDDVLETARTQIGKPYVWGGKSPSSSFDCSGFVSWATGGAVDAFTDAIPRRSTQVSANEARPGDVILFRYNDPGQPGVTYPHTALYTGNGRIIDAAWGRGVTEREMPNLGTAEYWRPNDRLKAGDARISVAAAETVADGEADAQANDAPPQPFNDWVHEQFSNWGESVTKMFTVDVPKAAADVVSAAAQPILEGAQGAVDTATGLISQTQEAGIPEGRGYLAPPSTGPTRDQWATDPSFDQFGPEQVEARKTSVEDYDPVERAARANMTPEELAEFEAGRARLLTGEPPAGGMPEPEAAGEVSLPDPNDRSIVLDNLAAVARGAGGLLERAFNAGAAGAEALGNVPVDTQGNTLLDVKHHVDQALAIRDKYASIGGGAFQDVVGGEQIVKENFKDLDRLNELLAALDQGDTSVLPEIQELETRLNKAFDEDRMQAAERDPDLALKRAPGDIAEAAAGFALAPGASAGVARNVAGLAADPTNVLGLGVEGAVGAMGIAGRAAGRVGGSERLAAVGRTVTGQVVPEDVTGVPEGIMRSENVELPGMEGGVAARRAAVGGAAGAAGGAATTEGEASPEERVKRAALGAVLGSSGVTAATVMGTKALVRAVDSGAISADTLAQHPQVRERVAAIMLAQADNTPAGQVVEVPALVTALQKITGDKLDGLDDVLAGGMTPQEVRTAIADVVDPETAFDNVKAILTDVVTGQNLRGRRAAETGADVAALGRADVGGSLSGVELPVTRFTEAKLLTEDLADAMGLDKPRVVQSTDPGILAHVETKEGQEVVTIGPALLRAGLTRDEIADVIAHEMAHIDNQQAGKTLLGFQVGKAQTMADQGQTARAGTPEARRYDPARAQQAETRVTEAVARLEDLERPRDIDEEPLSPRNAEEMRLQASREIRDALEDNPDLSGRYEVAPRVTPDGRERPEVKFDPVDPDRFYQAISEAAKVEKNGRLVGETVHVYEPDEYRKMQVFLSEDGKTGFALKPQPDGEVDMVSVFSVGVKGAGQEAALEGARRGATTLDAFNENGLLPKIYGRAGFELVREEPFNDEFAPPGWRGERPNIAYMRRTREAPIPWDEGRAGLYGIVPRRQAAQQVPPPEGESFRANAVDVTPEAPWRRMDPEELDRAPLPVRIQATLDQLGLGEPVGGTTRAVKWPRELVQEMLDSVEMIPTALTREFLGDFPEYLEPVARFIAEQREKAVSGQMTIRDVAKALYMTAASQGTGAQGVDTVRSFIRGVTDNLLDIPPMFQDAGKVRPEEAAAAWLFSPRGQDALNLLERGDAAPREVLDAWFEGSEVRRAYGDDRLGARSTRAIQDEGPINPETGQRRRQGLNLFGEPPKGKYNMTNLGDFVEQFNAAAQAQDLPAINRLVSKLNGIGTGKTGFIKHLLGFGDSPTVDAVEVNYWLTGGQRMRAGQFEGLGDIRNLPDADRAVAVQAKAWTDDNRVSQELLNRVTQGFEALRAEGVAENLDPRVYQHVMHHWLWDKAKGLETTHEGMYHAQRYAIAPRGKEPVARVDPTRVPREDNPLERLSPVGREAYEATVARTAERSAQARERTLDIAEEMIRKQVGRRQPDFDLRSFLDETLSEAERMLSESKMVATGISSHAVGAFFKTGRVTSKAEAGPWEKVVKITQGQVNVAGGRKGAAGEFIPYTLEDAAAFLDRESLQNKMVLGGSRFPTREGVRDEDAPKHLYAWVTDGQPMIGPNAPDLFMVWHDQTPRITTAHHPYALGSPGQTIHAQMPPGLRRATWGETRPMNPKTGQPGEYQPPVTGARLEEGPEGLPMTAGWEEQGVPLPSGRTIADTPWLVGPEGEAAMRANALLLSIPTTSPNWAKKIGRGELGTPTEAASQLMMGGRPRAAKYNQAAAVKSSNRTESLIVDPEPANVSAILLTGPAKTLDEPIPNLPKGSPRTRRDAAIAMAQRIEAEYGVKVPVLWKDPTDPDKLITNAKVLYGPEDMAGLAPGREEVVRNYTARGYQNYGIAGRPVEAADEGDEVRFTRLTARGAEERFRGDAEALTTAAGDVEGIQARVAPVRGRGRGLGATTPTTSTVTTGEAESPDFRRISGRTALNMPNIDKMAPDVPGVQQDIVNFARQNPEVIEQARRGVISHRMLVEKLAPELGMTADQFLRTKAGKAFNETELLVLRSAIVDKRAQAVSKTEELLARFGTRDINAIPAEDRAELLGMLFDVGRLQAVGRGAASTAGRTLNQQKIIIDRTMAQSITRANERIVAEKQAARAVQKARRALLIAGLDPDAALQAEGLPVPSTSAYDIAGRRGRLTPEEIEARLSGHAGEGRRLMRQMQEVGTSPDAPPARTKRRGQMTSEELAEQEALRFEAQATGRRSEEYTAEWRAGQREQIADENAAVRDEAAATGRRANEYVDEWRAEEAQQGRLLEEGNRAEAASVAQSQRDVARDHERQLTAFKRLIDNAEKELADSRAAAAAEAARTPEEIEAAEQAAFERTAALREARRILNASEIEAREAAAAIKRAEARQVRMRGRQLQKAQDALEKLGGDRVTTETLQQWMRIVDNPESDPADMANFMKSLGKTSWLQRAEIVRYAGMLSASSTHLTNAMSNQVQILGELATLPISVALDAAITRDPAERVFFMAQGRQMWKGMLAGYRDGAKEAAFIMRHGLRPEDVGKLEVFRPGFQSNIPAVGDLKVLKGLRVNDVADLAMEWPLRALGAADAYFRSGARGGYTRSFATREAMQNGYRGGNIEPEVERIMQNLADPDNDYLDLVEEAEQSARRAVLQENRDGPVQGLRAIKSEEGRFLVGLALPFVRTPYNIMAQGLALTPAGLWGVGRAAQAGDKKLAIERLSRVAVGTMMMGAAWQASLNGYMTGGSPTDAGDRNLNPPGWQPYSLKLPRGDGSNIYIGIHNLGPMSVPLAIAAIVGDAQREGVSLGTDAPSIAAMVAASTGKFMIDQSFMRGISDAINAVTAPDRKFEQWSEGLVPSFFPYNSLGRQVQRILGMSARDPKGAWEALLATYPTTAGLVPERTDALGEPVVGAQSGPGAVVSPFKYNVDRPEPALTTMKKLDVPLGNPPKSRRSPNDPEAEIELTREESRRYKQYVAEHLRQYMVQQTEQRPAERVLQAARENAWNRLLRDIPVDDPRRVRPGGLPPRPQSEGIELNLGG